ncbi:hypothetical protein [Paraburkholderia solisilvae]|uniref:hypothetical protein n=1 Tax=Paraburkholderia solisilvae TaxID=624376 RepID=UPI00158428B7|nr:hypothetical protein [Paraburkholderia solisilvae]
MLGRDFASKVMRVGRDAVQWRADQLVYAFVGQGQRAFADYVIVDSAALAETPHSVDILAAGAVPLTALTAWQGICDHRSLRTSRPGRAQPEGSQLTSSVALIDEGRVKVRVPVSGTGIESSVARYTESSETVATAVAASVTSSRPSSAQ